MGEYLDDTRICVKDTNPKIAQKIFEILVVWFHWGHRSQREYVAYFLQIKLRIYFQKPTEKKE